MLIRARGGREAACWCAARGCPAVAGHSSSRSPQQQPTGVKPLHNALAPGDNGSRGQRSLQAQVRHLRGEQQAGGGAQWDGWQGTQLCGQRCTQPQAGQVAGEPSRHTKHHQAASKAARCRYNPHPRSMPPAVTASIPAQRLCSNSRHPKGQRSKITGHPPQTAVPLSPKQRWTGHPPPPLHPETTLRSPRCPGAALPPPHAALLEVGRVGWGGRGVWW